MKELAIAAPSYEGWRTTPKRVERDLHKGSYGVLWGSMLQGFKNLPFVFEHLRAEPGLGLAYKVYFYKFISQSSSKGPVNPKPCGSVGVEPCAWPCSGRV